MPDQPQQITDPDEAAGLIRGIADMKAGRVKPLDHIDAELAASDRAVHQEGGESADFKEGWGAGYITGRAKLRKQAETRLKKLIRDWRMRSEKQAADYPSRISDCCREEIQGCASELEDELEGL